jgi:ABC-type sugar transport system ATPase subunit
MSIPPLSSSGNRAGVVRLARVEKVFGDSVAVQVDDLSIGPTELLALLGPSGSGKSTFLRMLAGLEIPTRGRIFWDEEDITEWQPAERDFAMVFQEYTLYPHMTVRQNIEFPLRMRRVPRTKRPAMIEAAARTVQIVHLLDRYPEQLSGGQRQRCALARAIVRRPKLFLLDEPFSGLDRNLRAEMCAEIKVLQRALGVSMIYVTHDQEEALSIADRIVVLTAGKVAQVGTPIERPGAHAGDFHADSMKA